MSVEQTSRIDRIKEEIKRMKENAPTPEQSLVVYKEYQKEFQKALFYFTQDNFFIGNLLQQFNFKASEQVPTAALCYDKKKHVFNVLVNPRFFMNSLKSLEERIAVLHHEILHFTNQHLFRFEMDSSVDKDEHKRANYATDLAINNYIKDLPTWCLHVRHFQTDDGKPFPLFQTAEIYHDLLKNNPNANDKAKENCKQEMKDKGENPGDSPGGEPGGLDEHEWESLTEEEKKQMADEMRGMIRRTIEKTNYGKSQVPDSIKDLLQEIETFIQALDYKRILMMAIKRHASTSDRSHTWYKPNKRYGNIAQGTMNAKLPRLKFYADTSGSISATELNSFLRVMDGFLSVGERKCEIGLWHTVLYSNTKYKRGQIFDKSLIESGGTDLTGVIEDINKVQPDLSIIFTDGEFYDSGDLKGEVIFIISEGGNLKHQFSEKFKTIPITGLKNS